MLQARAGHAELDVHPWGAPDGVRTAILDGLSEVSRRPHPEGEPLRSALSARLGGRVTLAGSLEDVIVSQARGARRVLVDAPCRVDYAHAAAALGLPVSRGTPARGDVVLIGRPNFPDGRMPSVDQVARLAVAHPGARFLVDESLLPYPGGDSAVPLTALLANVTVIGSLAAAWGVPGVDVAWCTSVFGRTARRHVVSGLAVLTGLACVDAWDWPRRAPLDAWRAALADALAGAPGVVSVTGVGPTVWVRLATPDAPERRAALRGAGVSTAEAADVYGIDDHHVCGALAAPEAVTVWAQALG